ncbi:hypothetical protein DPMN_123021 [Dreissena polymorpha]|uniref:Uncharacterized protein n=1 Tax=Dreissena polymorpha TaxID=45954 RepID=A0A9D4GQS0_DREPO|nr:hypothetical protein DPMN_123021 [Dreissena polymorpha]
MHKAQLSKNEWILTIAPTWLSPLDGPQPHAPLLPSAYRVVEAHILPFSIRGLPLHLRNASVNHAPATKVSGRSTNCI